MHILWLNPLAWFGLLALLVPIVIHLLTNQQTRRVPFPTLRFLMRTRLAALRRRVIQNWMLLALRMFVLAAAVAALAAPLVVSPSRQREWRERVARAIVIAPGSVEGELAAMIAGEQRDTFASALFAPAHGIADGLRDASVWLERQPPAAREVVVIGEVKRDAIGPADLRLLPDYVGVRFLPVTKEAALPQLSLRFREGDGTWLARTTLSDRATRVAYEPSGALTPPVAVRADPAEMAAANAVLSAVLARGVELDGADERRLIVLFEGASAADLTIERPPRTGWMKEALAALPDLRGGSTADALVVEAGRRVSASDAAQAVERVVRVAFTRDRRSSEPSYVPASALASWSRPAGEFEGGQVQDEGDRRWLWAGVLLLLAVETFARRARPAAPDDVTEARVA